MPVDKRNPSVMSQHKEWGIGLMSGTSADGVDAVLVEVHEAPLKVRLGAFQVYPFSSGLRARIVRASSPDAPLREVASLNMELGEAFAGAAMKLLKSSRLPPEKISFVGSHGQTLYHHPRPKGKQEAPFTVQVGEGSVIAERTGFLTVSDFRAADMAAGGEGAPLVPYVDWKLFSHPEKGRVLLNLGGIANFTYLPQGGTLKQIVACDCGPGNALLDALTFLTSNGKKNYDSGGRLGARGKINFSLLENLLRHPFLKLSPPKSAEKSWFGEAMARSLLKRKLPSHDLMATAAAFTAEAAARHLSLYAAHASEIFVSGGGVKNLTLMRMLRESVSREFGKAIPIHHFERLGMPSKAREAVAFAFLAYETLKGRPSNAPGATGARRACILGKISPGWRRKWKLL